MIKGFKGYWDIGLFIAALASLVFTWQTSTSIVIGLLDGSALHIDVGVPGYVIVAAFCATILTRRVLWQMRGRS